MNRYYDSQHLRDALKRRETHPVALVPTMGYLHEGHATLVREAAKLAPRVVVSVFVNPLQFGPTEDFQRYPRNPDRDQAIAEKAGATDIYFPNAATLTPPDLAVKVTAGPLAEHLCGRSRPGHFDGVCTIVAKLFNIVQPDYAVFGWKDAQQFLILQKMVKDLDFPVQMIGVETIRESDGLAMSSRNTYLSPQERSEAPEIRKALLLAERAVKEGITAADRLECMVRDHLTQNTSARIDYITIVSMDSVQPATSIQHGTTMLAVAAYFGNTRLIDNIRF